MTLGDLNKDAVAVAQSITSQEKGVAVCTGTEGGWDRARSHLTTAEEARKTASAYAGMTPELPGLDQALKASAGGEIHE